MYATYKSDMWTIDDNFMFNNQSTVYHLHQKNKNTVIMFSFAGKENEARVWKTGQDGDEHLGMLWTS